MAKTQARITREEIITMQDKWGNRNGSFATSPGGISFTPKGAHSEIHHCTWKQLGELMEREAKRLEDERLAVLKAKGKSTKIK